MAADHHQRQRRAILRQPRHGAQEIDLHPLMSGVRTEDEGLFVLQHHYWQQQMIKAVQQEQDKLIHVEGA